MAKRKTWFCEIAIQATPILAASVVPLSVIAGRASIAVSLGLTVLALLVSRPRLSWPFSSASLAAVLLAVGVVLVGWMPSLFASGHMGASLRSWAGSGTLCLATVGVIAALARPPVPRPALRAFLLSMLVVLVVAVLSMTLFPGLLSFRSATFPADRVLKASASVVACAVPVMLLCGLVLGRQWLATAVVTSVIGVVMIVLTHSRSALAGLALGLMVGLAAYLWRRLGTVRTLTLALVVALAAGWGASSLLPWNVPQTQYGAYHLRVPAWLVDAHRQVIWQFVWDRHQERVWFGWGINTINQAPGADDIIPGLQHEYVPSHPHNWTIEVLAETGIVGFAPLSVVVVVVVGALAWVWRQRGNPATLAGLTLWLVFWTSSLSNFSFWSAWWQTSMAALVFMTALCANPLRAGTAKTGEQP